MADPSFFVGIVGNIISILVFTSPIATFRRVLRNKSTEEFRWLPYVTTLLCTSLWAFYGLLKPGGLLIITVNAAGAALQAVYVTLYLAYAPRDTKVKMAKVVVGVNICFFAVVVVVGLVALHGAVRLFAVGVLCSALTIAMYAAPMAAMVPMGNSKSKATEHATESDAPTGHMDGSNVDEPNPEFMTVPDNVYDSCPTSPGHIDGSNVNEYSSEVMSVADNVLESCTTCPAVESSHEEVGSQVRHNARAPHGSESNPTTKHQQSGAVFTDDKLDQLNTLSLAAGTTKTIEATVNLQVGNHNSLTMLDLDSIQRDKDVKRELKNARRRAAYRKKKDECTIKLQNDVQDFPRPAVGDITNVHRPSRKMPDNPTISFMQNDASFPSPSNLTLGYATDVPQSSNVPIESDHTDDVQNVT